MSEKWCIVADSACDLTIEEGKKLGIAYEKIPFMLLVGKNEYIDDGSIDIDVMLDDMEAQSEAARSSCASPGTWAEAFEKYDNTVAVTISSELSGSYNSALTAKQMMLEDHPEKKICVIDSKSTGPALVNLVYKAAKYIKHEMPFDEVNDMLQKNVEHMHTVFALCSFNNLVKNGRMNKIAGFLAGKLGFWGVGVAKNGKVCIKGKARGLKAAIAEIMKDFKENNFDGGKVFISHCNNLAAAERIKKEILSLHPDSKVKIMQTGGLDSFYAERNGLIITYI